MTFFEWFWLIVALVGAAMAFNAWRADLDFHGAAMDRSAGLYFGISIAATGGVLFLIALAI